MRKYMIAFGVGLFAAGLLVEATPAEAQNRFGGSRLLGTQVQGITGAVRTAIRLARDVRLGIKTGEKIDVLALEVDGENRYMATGLGDGSVRLWSLRLGREVRRLTGHDGAVRALSLNRDGTVLAVGDAAGQAFLYAVPSGERLGSVRAHDGQITAMTLSPAGDLLVTGDDGGALRAWDPRTATPRGTLTAHPGGVTTLTFSRDGGTVLVGGADGVVRAYDAASLAPRAELRGHDATVVSVNVDDFGTRAVTVDSGSEVKVWDLAAGTEIGGFTASGGGVLAADVSNDDRLVALGTTDNAVRIYDVASGTQQKNLQGHTAEIRSVQFDATQRFLHSASTDGTSRVWDVPEGKSVATVVSSVSGWTVVGEDGQFDGSVEGAAAVEWRTSEGNFELDQFSDTHFQPGVLALVLEGDGAPEEGMVVVTQGFALPPAVKVVAGDRSGDSIDVRMEITNEGGGISNARLYHNGRLITDASPGVELLDRQEEEEEHVLAYRVRMIAQDNFFRAVAGNADGIESAPSELVVNNASGTRPGQAVLHLLVVGINRYKNPSLNLNYGVPDAKGIASFFQNARNQPFGEVRTYQVFDDAATRSNILDHMAILQDSRPEDMVVIYLAGHGETVGEDWYFVPHEVTRPNDGGVLSEGGLSASALQELVPMMGAHKVVVLFDACKAGAAVEAFRGFTEQKAFRKVARNTGIHIVAAAGRDQFAAELPTLGHGVFTYTLLEALRGEADSQPRDGRVSIEEIANFVNTRVPERSAELNGNIQYPMISSKGVDFALANAL